MEIFEQMRGKLCVTSYNVAHSHRATIGKGEWEIWYLAGEPSTQEKTKILAVCQNYGVSLKEYIGVTICHHKNEVISCRRGSLGQNTFFQKGPPKCILPHMLYLQHDTLLSRCSYLNRMAELRLCNFPG